MAATELSAIPEIAKVLASFGCFLPITSGTPIFTPAPKEKYATRLAVEPTKGLAIGLRSWKFPRSSPRFVK